MTCACGAPAFIQKSSECKRCYHRRYQREHYVAKPTFDRSTVTALTLAEVEADLFEAFDEHARTLRNAAVVLWKAEHPQEVAAEHSRYWHRNKSELRERRRESKAEWAARPDNRLKAREREAQWRKDNPERIRARKMARYYETRLPRGTRLCSIASCKAPHLSKGLCRPHYMKEYRMSGVQS